MSHNKTCTPQGVVGSPDDFPCAEVALTPAMPCKLGAKPITTPVSVVFNTGDECRPMGLVDADGKLVFATDCIASDQLNYLAMALNNHESMVKALRDLLMTFQDCSHYETKNPYRRKEVIDGLKVLKDATGYPGIWMNANNDHPTAQER